MSSVSGKGATIIKCLLLGLSSDFERDTGEGTQRYGYELYKGLKKYGIKIEKNDYQSIFRYSSHVLFDDFGDFDIIHIPNFRLFYPARKGRAATLVTAHDFQPLLNPEMDVKHDATLQNRMWFEFVKLSLKRTLLSDYLMCNSTLTRQDAVTLGYDKDKAFVSNHGLDDRFRDNKRANKPGKGFLVGYLSAFRARKNVAFAIKAFKKIERQGFAFELWGRKAFEYDYLADLSKTDRRIKFMGFAPEGKLVDTYDRFDAFVYPSLYEGEGLPVLEAQARGLPVVIYKKGKIAKEIRKYCFEAEDEGHMAQIIMQLKENGYNERLRKDATEYARGFTWEKTAKGTFEAYTKICWGPPG